MRLRAGFTLLEVLVVMVIGGIVAGTAMPRLTAGLEQSRLQRATAVVASDMRLAHSLAERRRAPVVITVDTILQLVRVQDTASPATVYSTRRLGGSNGGFGIGNTSASSGGRIVVYPNGLASGELTITLSAGKKSRAIRMTRAGLVRVSTP